VGVAGADAARVVAGIVGAAPAPMHSIERDDIVAVGLDPARFVLFAPAALGGELEADLAAAAARGTPEAWDRSVIHAGIPTVVAGTQEAFVPQMANFELVGGVSFRKGCYPGQEIVARMQYRGGLKRRMVLAHADTKSAPAPGDGVLSASFGDQAAGTIANVAPATQGGYDMLVVAQLDSIERGDLRLGDGTPLRLMDLPYEVPR
jgi:folate-binding protein YgfZ